MKVLSLNENFFFRFKMTPRAALRFTGAMDVMGCPYEISNAERDMKYITMEVSDVSHAASIKKLVEIAGID